MNLRGQGADHSRFWPVKVDPCGHAAEALHFSLESLSNPVLFLVG